MAVANARSQRTGEARGPTTGSSLLKVGDLLAGKYRVERILGEGGMGVVVAAHHELLDQHVAVKLLYQDIADREAQSRLLAEARAAARLQSDHVARVVDVDTGADGLPFIVMELLEGADLCQIADARGALPRWLVVDYLLQALDGLAHAHARGIIHRDLKPSNLFLANRPDGTQIIKILDFGISKTLEPEDASGERRRSMQLTGGRAVLGSPPYMSPEQVRSPKTVDLRTDIWSLGIVMYELLTNSMPFGGGEIQETFAQILEKHPQPIRNIVTGVPEGLERVVARCLAKNRDERFADVAELARALAPFGSGTWSAAPERVALTLARGSEDALTGPRAKPPISDRNFDRIAIPSSPGRRSDSMQPELHGTASTVARRFTVFDEPYRIRNLLAAAAVIGTAGVLLAAGAVFQRSRAEREASAATFTAATSTGDTPPQSDAPAPFDPAPNGLAVVGGGATVPIVGAATSLVTAPVHPVGPESDVPPTAPVQSGIAMPEPTVIGASVPSPLLLPSAPPLLQSVPPASRRGPVSTPRGAPPRRSTSTPVAAAQQPAPSLSTPKVAAPALPPGLPRDRQ